MCGINGIINLNGDTVTPDKIGSMNRKIKHRGPDDTGFLNINNVGLGHVRLSVIDLSKMGHQPMTYQHQRKKAVITYNGEIYNFKELKEELKTKGYYFSSNTDTEVVLASYIEYGFDCLNKFNGMFAFVIYDINNNIIFGARDRFGQKPLKYYIDDKQFIFSSELKAILENNIKREIDFDAIDDYLTLQYVPTPKTGFKNIYKLPHSHYFILDLQTKKFEIKRYFDLDYSKKLKHSKKEWMKIIEQGLEKAVKKRLISDVPLGAFLSGGVDSSAIVAFMSKFSNKVKTFSISFDHEEFDESGYAKKVAKKFNTKHTEFKIQVKDLLKYIDDLVYQFEEPYADSSSLPTFILSKLTKKYVTVALSGDAGDENFGGYDKYKRHLLVMKLNFLFRILRPIRKIIRNDKIQIIFNILNFGIGRKHYNFTNYFDEFSKQKLCKDNFKNRLTQKDNIFDKLLEIKNFDGLDKIFYLDFNSYLPDDLNVKVDMASMLNALEVRSPLLDFELVSTMAKMPWNLKVDILNGKKIFKKMLEKYLPRDILNRKKHGFSVPIKYWFRNELKDYLKNVILDNQGLVLQIMKEKNISKLIKDHESGQDKAKKLWTLMVLNIWYKKNFTNL